MTAIKFQIDCLGADNTVLYWLKDICKTVIKMVTRCSGFLGEYTRSFDDIFCDI